MKKVLTSLLLSVVLAATMIGFAACGDKNGPYKASQDAYYFSLSTYAAHCGLTFIHAKTDAKGNLEGDFVVDEIFLPNEWAKINVADAANLSEDNQFRMIKAFDTANGEITGEKTNILYDNATLYPKYIWFDGVKYEAKQITSGTDALTSAIATPADSTNHPFEQKFTFLNSGNNRFSTQVRYFKSGSAASLETTLGGDQALAKKYYEACKSTTIGFEYGNGTDGATKVGLIRATGAAAKDATKIRVGAPTTATDTAQTAFETTGALDANAAYANTFFKLDSAYGPRFTIEGNTAASFGEGQAALLAYVNQVGIENLTAAKIDSGAKGEKFFEIDGVSTGATAGNIQGYLKLYVGIYNLIKA